MSLCLFYIRTPLFFQQLTVAIADGHYPRIIKTPAKAGVLAELGPASISSSHRLDLLEVIKDRDFLTSTIVATQIPRKNRHKNIRGPPISNTIPGRLACHPTTTLAVDTKFWILSCRT